jgi:sigma-B regulation protein RsbU (phosphoserine phosphatase)
VTLFRTYAADFASRYPQSFHRRLNVLFNAINRRLIKDSQDETFVTAFFGVLDPKNATLSYVNAGHNPPYLFNRDRRRRIRALRPTGPALGFFEEFTWKRKTVKLDPGSLLLIYTDGLTEAQNLHGGFFEDERVMHVVRDNLHQPIEGLCNAILASVYDFAGDAPRSDDITLMLIRREVGPIKEVPR